MPEQYSQTAICLRHGLAREVVQVQPAPISQPGPGFVRVRMTMAPINPSDLLFCRGTYGIGPEPPKPVGLEGVGIVEAHGPGWLGWLRQGKRVAVISRSAGTWSTHCLTQAETVVPVPDSLSDEQAAVYFINPATALLMTRWILKVPEKAWIMQSAANSAVGRMIIRLGRHFNFRTLNVVRHASQVAELQALGADAVVVVQESTPPAEFLSQVREITRGDLPRCAVDPVGGPIGGLLFGSLGEGGRMLCFASLSEEPIPVHPRELITQNRSLESFWLGRAMEALPLSKKLRFIGQLSRLHCQGLFQVESFETYPLDEVTAALQALEHKPGGRKILLKLSPETKGSGKSA